MRLLAAFLALSLSQAQQSAPEQSAGPLVRVTTRLVQINVLAHDKHGQPVSDLTKDDFVILDRGKRQKIATFQIDTTGAPPKTAQALPPNIFSNEIEYKGNIPTNITVLLFDGLNTHIADQAYARQQLIKFLGTLEPQDRVAIYLLGRRLTILHDFSGSADHLARVLAKFTGRISPELEMATPDPSNTGVSQIDDLLNESNRMMSDYANINRVHTTAAAMEAIAAHLAGVPGRKSLVWISSAFPFSIGFDPDALEQGINFHGEQRTFNPEIERVGRAMNASNVAIYPVDARGLVVGNFDASKSGPSPGMPGRGRPVVIPRSMGPPQENFDTMRAMAERTGGKAFYNTNDIKGAIRSSIDDARVSYTLGFYPSAEDWDDKFHPLKVEVQRKGVSLRARRGYFATAEHAASDRDRNALIVDAFESPIEATGVGISARIDPSTNLTNGVRIAAIVDSSNLSFTQKDGRYAGYIDMLISQRDASGARLDTVHESVEMKLLPERYAEIRRKGLIITKDFLPKPDAADFRLVIYDRPSGNIGSLEVPWKRP